MKRMIDKNEIPSALIGQDIEVKSVNASGLIQGDEIIEKMSGYDLEMQSKTGYTLSPVYGGIVKNGNKLTIVGAAKVTKTAEAVDSVFTLFICTIPSEVGAAIYPVEIAGNNFVINKQVQAFSSFTSSRDVKMWAQKPNSTTITIGIDTNNLVQDATYYIRFEATILLSENLLQVPS